MINRNDYCISRFYFLSNQYFIYILSNVKWVDPAMEIPRHQPLPPMQFFQCNFMQFPKVQNCW